MVVVIILVIFIVIVVVLVVFIPLEVGDVLELKMGISRVVAFTFCQLSSSATWALYAGYLSHARGALGASGSPPQGLAWTPGAEGQGLVEVAGPR